MPIPVEYRTARYESLPKGLKAKAESIIKSKFGLSTLEHRPEAKFEYTGIDSASGKDFSSSYQNPLGIFSDVNIIYVKQIFDRLQYTAGVACAICDCHFVFYIEDRFVVEKNNSFENSFICLCGKKRFYIPSSYFDDARQS